MSTHQSSSFLVGSHIDIRLAGIGTDVSTPTRIENLVIAGWTGKNAASIAKHVQELVKIGVRPPKHTPMFYRVSAALLTTSSRVQVIGETSTGEVEVVLLNQSGELLVGLGSDHTDREAERLGVTLSKQMCPKVIAPTMWRLSDVSEHWSELILRSYATLDGQRTLYQEGSVSGIRSPQELVDLYREHCPHGFPDRSAMFCGTLAVLGDIRWASRFVMELEDPVLGRRITHAYDISALPIEEY